MEFIGTKIKQIKIREKSYMLNVLKLAASVIVISVLRFFCLSRMFIKNVYKKLIKYSLHDIACFSTSVQEYSAELRSVSKKSSAKTLLATHLYVFKMNITIFNSIYLYRLWDFKKWIFLKQKCGWKFPSFSAFSKLFLLF